MARQAFGTGASLRNSCAVLRSVQKSGGIASSSSATFCRTSCAAIAPGMTLLTAGWARTNCSAAAGSVTPWRAHTLSILRTRSMIWGGAGW